MMANPLRVINFHLYLHVAEWSRVRHLMLRLRNAIRFGLEQLARHIYKMFLNQISKKWVGSLTRALFISGIFGYTRLRHEFLVECHN